MIEIFSFIDRFYPIVLPFTVFAVMFACWHNTTQLQWLNELPKNPVTSLIILPLIKGYYAQLEFFRRERHNLTEHYADLAQAYGTTNEINTNVAQGLYGNAFDSVIELHNSVTDYLTKLEKEHVCVKNILRNNSVAFPSFLYDENGKYFLPLNGITENIEGVLPVVIFVNNLLIQEKNNKNKRLIFLSKYLTEIYIITGYIVQNKNISPAMNSILYSVTEEASFLLNPYLTMYTCTTINADFEQMHREENRRNLADILSEQSVREKQKDLPDNRKYTSEDKEYLKNLTIAKMCRYLEIAPETPAEEIFSILRTQYTEESPYTETTQKGPTIVAYIAGNEFRSRGLSASAADKESSRHFDSLNKNNFAAIRKILRKLYS